MNAKFVAVLMLYCRSLSVNIVIWTDSRAKDIALLALIRARGKAVFLL